MLADILQQVDDLNFRKGKSKGWYYSQLEQAMTELSYDTFALKATCDIKIDQKNFAVEIPEEMFNIREVYLISPDKNGVFTNSANVYHKRLFNNRGKGSSYTAKVRRSGSDGFNGDNGGNGDPFYANYVPINQENLYTWAVIGRTLMLSSNVTGFTHVRIVANTTAAKLGDAPIILRILRQAIKAYVCVEFFSAMKAKDKAYRADWADWTAIKEKEWGKAAKRISSMDTAEKESLLDALSSIGIQNLF